MLALDYAAYLNVDLAVAINLWVYRYITGDQTLIKDVQARVDEVHGTKSLLTHTIVDKEASDQKLAVVHEQAAGYQASLSKLQAELTKAKLQIEESNVELVNTKQEQAYVIEGLRKQIRDMGVYPDTNLQTLQSVQTKRRKLNDTIEVLSEFLQPLQQVDTLWNQMYEKSTLQKDVYFIRMVNTSYVKIGFSGDVIQRLKQLSIGNAILLQLDYKFKSSRYRLHESSLHAYFIDNNVRGEWFELPTDTNYDNIVHKVCKLC